MARIVSAYPASGDTDVSHVTLHLLAAGARIWLDSAHVLAIHTVSHGHVVAEELERDHGRIIYSFEARVPGKSGISEVNVDAGDGKVLGVHPRVSGGPSEGGTRRQRGCEEGGNVALEAARVNDTFE